MKLHDLVSPWWRDLDDEILDMEHGTVCGSDVLALLRKADDLLSALPDISMSERLEIIEAVKHQARVLYFG